MNAWRETPSYNERERAALTWAGALTRIAQEDVSDALYAEVRPHFREKEIVGFALAIIASNGWHRLAIAFCSTPGSLQPKAGRPRA